MSDRAIKWILASLIPIISTAVGTSVSKMEQYYYTTLILQQDHECEMQKEKYQQFIQQLYEARIK